MIQPLSIEPIVGDWYESHGQLFEVVAIDDEERVVEIQHADGDLEEIDADDWATRCRAASLSHAEPPEDARLADDRDDGIDLAAIPGAFDELQGLRAGAFDDLELFSTSDVPD
jgi:hypothetical protein